MKNFTDTLRKFNTKERFYLIGYALGNTEFCLSDNFLMELSKCLSINISKENIFVGIDYHLDWVYGSLVLFTEGKEEKIFPNHNHNHNQNKFKMIYGTQEDSDLLICFKEKDVYHIIFIEAKGVMPWNKKQLNSKIKRLKELFGDTGNLWENIVPHFLMLCPKKLTNLDSSAFPEWALINGSPFELRLPIPVDLIKITRCDETPRKDKNGDFWKLDKINK